MADDPKAIVPPKPQSPKSAEEPTAVTLADIAKGLQVKPNLDYLIAPANAAFLEGVLSGVGRTANFNLNLPGHFDWKSIATIPPFAFPDPVIQSKSRSLETEITQLKRQVAEQAQALRAERTSVQEKDQQNAALARSLRELRDKEQLNFLLTRVNDDAQKVLLENPAFRENFLGKRDAFVMSVDIRRSTELMLKARDAEAFAAFITTLCATLEQIVRQCYGVIDKFTGDGILAFFPDFYSGTDAGYYVVAAADSCHKAFADHYGKSRSSFNSVLRDVGLGIGIDYGATHLVRVAGGLTVVGPPVVYACRMGSAPAGQTLLNQPAYEKIGASFSGNCFFHETELEIKHEGPTLAYSVTLNGKPHQPAPPAWLTEAKTVAQAQGSTPEGT